MIPTESRMREIRTSGSTSGGVETDRMGAGLSTEAKATDNAPDPNRHRATPRLYVRRGKARFPGGCEPHPATVVPAGSGQGGSWR